MEVFIVGTVCLFVGLVIGHRMARVKIEEDCEKLGGFYVGGRIYYCNHIEQAEDKPTSTAAPDLPHDHPLRKVWDNEEDSVYDGIPDKPEPPKSRYMKEGSDEYRDI